VGKKTLRIWGIGGKQAGDKSAVLRMKELYLIILGGRKGKPGSIGSGGEAFGRKKKWVKG